MPTFKLSNPKVMQTENTFADVVDASSAKQAAKKLFNSLVEHMHNSDKVNLIITFNQEGGSGKVHNYKCTKENAEQGSSVSVVSYKIPKKAVSAGVWGEQAGGGALELREKTRKFLEKKKKKQDSDSDSDSDSDDLVSYSSPIYFIYDPFYYGNYLYSSYILNRSVMLPNFSYNLSGYWWF